MIRIGRLIRYGLVAAIAGTAGFLLGGGELPDELGQASVAFSERAQDLAQSLPDEENAMTDALNDARDSVTDGLRRMSGLLDR